MPAYKGGVVRLDTKDKETVRKLPAQKHNLSYACDRILIAGPPGSGKSATAIQMVCRSAPIAEIYVLHGTPGTAEYDCLTHTKLEKPLSAKEWAAESKKHGGKFLCCIVDDYQGCDCTKKENADIRMLLRTCSSHMNILVIMTAHTLTNVPATWRRCMSAFVIYRPQDMATVPYLARQIGLSTAHLRGIFKMLKTRGKHSALHVEDNPPPGRARLRVDGEHEVILSDDD